MKHKVEIDLKKYPKINEIYETQIWDDDKAIEEFSDMCVDTYQSGYNKGYIVGSVVGTVGATIGVIIASKVIYKMQQG